MSRNKYVSRRWSGYTLEELRNQRALVQARIMIERHRLATSVDDVRHSVLTRTRPTTVLGRILGALSYLDWAILGVTLFRKFSPLFNKKKHR